MKIAILTGGGDVPSLNSAIKGLAQGAIDLGWEAVGIRNGWLGLTQVEPSDAESCDRWLMPLSAHVIRTIDRTGGTCLHSSRTNPGRMTEASLPNAIRGAASTYRSDDGSFDITPRVLASLSDLKIDLLFAIGGDDTLGYAARLHREGFSIIGIPKTMDNDVNGTDYCLGFATCVSRSVSYLHALRTSLGSHERIGVIEVMGRNSGATSLWPAYLASLDRAIIAEVPFDPERLTELLMRDRSRHSSRYALFTISEGARFEGGGVVESGQADAFGHRKLGGIGVQTGEMIKQLTGEGIIYQNLGYLVRSGVPDPLDVMVTFNFANLALELARKKIYGQLVCLEHGCYGHKGLEVVAGRTRTVDVDNFYNRREYRPDVRSVLGLPFYLR